VRLIPFKRWKVWLFYTFCVPGLVLLLTGFSAAAVQTDGPLVGGVTDSSAKVFVRTDVSAFVTVQFSEEASLKFSVQTPPALTHAEADFTAIITLNGLRPETTYYYRILVNGVPQQTAPFPFFTTFPIPGTPRDFRFAVVADLINVQNHPTTPAPAYAHVMAEAPAFVLQIGDFDHRDPSTLPRMRQMHREVRGPYTASGFDFARYLASKFPLFHIFDDHDYGINNGDKTFSGRALALQAFREYYPVPDLPNPSAGIWYKFSYGQAEFFMLDLRSQRDPDGDPDNSEKSILDGDLIPDGQKAWLKANLLASTARWKFLISSVSFNPTSKPRDSWGAFATEHAEMVDFIRQNHIQGVVTISGDLHSGGGIDDGTYAGFPEITVPHTNLTGGDSGPKGKWSEGLISGSVGGGYALLTVLTNPDRVILEAKGAHGGLRKKLVIPTFVDATRSAGLAEAGFTFGNPIWGDFDNDGDLDLFVDNHYQSPPFLYRNEGDGTFTDVQPSSGIISEEDYHGTAWGDFDNDGDLDLFITQGARGGFSLGRKQDELCLNVGTGQFVDVAQAAGVTNSFGRGRSVAWGDYNNDGYLDLLVGNLQTPLVLYKNNGNGTFQDVTVEAHLGNLGYPECAFADYNNDGFPDIFCTGGFLPISVPLEDILLKNNGDGTFTEVSQAAHLLPLAYGKAVAWGDYDNDGDLDLFISRGYNDQSDSLSWNRSAIAFSDVTNAKQPDDGLDFQIAEAADLNSGPLRFDLYLDGAHQPPLVSIGREAGHPNEIPFSLTQGSGTGKPAYMPGRDLGFFIWQDLPGNWHLRWSGDGKTHHVYGTITGCCIASVAPLNFKPPPSLKDTLYENNGDGTFTEVTDRAGVGNLSNNNAAVWGDFDNDGDLDLYVVNSGSSASGNGPNYLYRNNGDKTFTNVAGIRGVEALVTGRGRGAAWEDYDDDGFLDLFVTNGQDPFPFTQGSHLLYHNEGNGNNWLKVKLIGTVSNRQGIGAKVLIQVGRHLQYAEANGGGGGHFLSQGAGPLHFGLGPATLVDQLRIQWPSGLKQTLKNVSVNQEITVVEGR